MTDSESALHPALWLVPCIMLLVALAPWPYAYYQLLRLVVCVCVGVITYRLYEAAGVTFWVVALGALAVLFNPIVPFHLTREIWGVFNVAGSVLLAAHFFVWRKARLGSRSIR